MQAHSQTTVNSLINEIILKVWDGVGVENIKRMAPISARLQAFEVAHTHIMNENKNMEKLIPIKEQPQAITIPLDTFSVNSTTLETKPKDQQKFRKLSIANSTIRSQVSQRRHTNNSFFSIKSVSQAKSKIVEGHEQQLFKLPEQKDEHGVYDPQQDKIRQKKFLYEKEDQRNRQMIEDRQRSREQLQAKSKKALKDIKKFTHDYGGGFLGIGNVNPGQDKILKLAPKNHEQIISKKSSKQTNQSEIVNERSKQRQTKTKLKDKQKVNDSGRPYFDQNRPQSLIDAFDDESKLSEGVKLKSNKGNSELIKQRIKKYTGLNKYRRNQYQNLIKDKKFVDYSSVTHSNPQLTNETQINKTTPLPIEKQPISQQYPSSKVKTKSELSFKGDKVFDEGILPPIKINNTNNDRNYLKKSFRKHYYSKSHSNRSINIDGLNSRLTIKSKQKIIIDNEQDFKLLLGNYKD